VDFSNNKITDLKPLILNINEPLKCYLVLRNNPLNKYSIEMGIKELKKKGIEVYY